VVVILLAPVYEWSLDMLFRIHVFCIMFKVCLRYQGFLHM